jgi:hypothetical protein
MSKCYQMSNGSELWMKDGKLHREDGAAVYNSKTNKFRFYLEGKPVSYKTWFIEAGQNSLTPQQVTLMLIKLSGDYQ